MSAHPTAAAGAATAPPKKKKLMLIVIVAVVVLAIAGGGAAYFLLNKSKKKPTGHDEEPAHQADTHKVAPVFLPLENMVVNLADEGGERFAQVGITLEVTSEKISEEIKPYLPIIRSGILLSISQKTSAELLQREGKEALAKDILREVSKPLGYPFKDKKASTKTEHKAEDKTEDEEEEPPVKKNPVKKVVFSSFIIQ